MWPEFCLLAASPWWGTTVAGTGSVGEGVNPTLDAVQILARRRQAMLVGSVVPPPVCMVVSELAASTASMPAWVYSSQRTRRERRP